MRDGFEDGLGDERERALRSDDEAAEDLERGLGVEECAEPVAHRVLDPELAPDPLRQVGVGEDLVADLEQAPAELRLGRREALLGVGGLRVDDGAGRQDELQRAQRLVGVVDDAAAHAARVVRDHAADACDVGARRVRSDAARVRREYGVRPAEDRAGLHASARSVVLDLDTGPVAADVDQDAVGLPLAVQARAAGAERHRYLLLARVRERLRDVAGVLRHDDGAREQPVRARVGRVLDEVEHAREHAVGSQERDQLRLERLGGPRCPLILNAVRRRRGIRRSDSADVRREQVH